MWLVANISTCEGAHDNVTVVLMSNIYDDINALEKMKTFGVSLDNINVGVKVSHERNWYFPM